MRRDQWRECFLCFIHSERNSCCSWSEISWDRGSFPAARQQNNTIICNRKNINKNRIISYPSFWNKKDTFSICRFSEKYTPGVKKLSVLEYISLTSGLFIRYDNKDAPMSKCAYGKRAIHQILRKNKKRRKQGESGKQQSNPCGKFWDQL